MTTFDQILPIAKEVLSTRQDLLNQLDWLLINRDLNGRVRFIVPEAVESNAPLNEHVKGLYQALAEKIAPHAYPVASGILYEESPELAYQGAVAFALTGVDKVWVIDRLATESCWERIADVSPNAPRIVFFSIKGGVGRSTALAASAWALAQQGKRVMVLDLDLESPGLSSALLSSDRQPTYGITDWLVEDLVDNGDRLIEDLFAISDLQTAGVIHLIPAHGREPGEYISKLGRVWMPKITPNGTHESWSARLNRLVDQLEDRLNPDVILIDSRAGIDEVAAACVTDLGAHTVFMFAIQGTQTWTGYRALFNHWALRDSSIFDIRDRLQLVAGLVPDDGKLEYLDSLRADAYQLFESIYDELGAGEIDGWNFEEDDDTAPHAPLSVRWSRGWYGLLSLQQRMVQVDANEVRSVYGPLLDFLDRAVVSRSPA